MKIVSHREFLEYRRKRRVVRSKPRVVAVNAHKITLEVVNNYLSFELMVAKVRRHLSRQERKLSPKQFEMAIAILDRKSTDSLIGIVESSVPKTRRARPDYYLAVLEVLDSRFKNR